MKLFYWSEVRALADYSPGEIIVMAETLEEARALVTAKATSDNEWWEVRRTRIITEILNDAPNEIIDVPCAIFIMGSG